MAGPPAIRPMGAADGPAVLAIYAEGLATGNATLETVVPGWAAWDAGHHPAPRLVAESGAQLLGWAALLQGDCAVLTVRDPMAPHLLAPDERHALVVELLTAVRSSTPAGPLWLPLAARLLAKEYATAGLPPSPPPAVRPVRELAREMLALELG